MDFLSDFLNGVASTNWEPLFQLSLVGLILVSGPIVIFLLAVRGGDL